MAALISGRSVVTWPPSPAISTSVSYSSRNLGVSRCKRCSRSAGRSILTSYVGFISHQRCRGPECEPGGHQVAARRADAERGRREADHRGQQQHGVHGMVHLISLLPHFCPVRENLRSEEHTSELQSLRHLVCRLLLEKKNINSKNIPDQNIKQQISGRVNK